VGLRELRLGVDGKKGDDKDDGGGDKASGSEEETEVWTPHKEGWTEEEGLGYLSVNATSLDVGQEGLDLREWHEKGWIAYLDTLENKEENRMRVPFVGGMY